MRNYLHRIIKSLFIISSLILISTGTGFAKTVVTLAFYDTVTVNDTVVYVEDIAVVSTESPEIRQRIEAAVAGEIAPPGYSRFINTTDLLLYRLQPAFKDYEFKTLKNKRIVVKTVGIVRKVAHYTDSVERYLGEHIGWKKNEWSFIIENQEDTWKSLDLPIAVTVEGFVAEKNIFPRGHITLQLVAKQRNRITRIPLSCKLKISVPVAVARRGVVRGKVIDSSDIEMKRVDFSDFGPDPFYKIEDIVGQKAIRTISQGTIYFNRLFTPVPAVSKGDQLAIKISKGNVIISVMAIARENGSIGQKIWVENATTHKLVRVIIKDKTIGVIL